MTYNRFRPLVRGEEFVDPRLFGIKRVCGRGGGRVHCACALCAAPGLRHVGVAQGEAGGGDGGQ